jgi:hypothetical protein
MKRHHLRTVQRLDHQWWIAVHCRLSERLPTEAGAGHPSIEMQTAVDQVIREAAAKLKTLGSRDKSDLAPVR